MPAETPIPARAPGVRRGAAVVLLVAAAILPMVPVLRAGFLAWDDSHYLTQNYRVHHLTVESVRDLFRLHTRCGPMPNGQYTPLVELSYALEHRLFGLNPFPYHADNLLLHALNTLLVALWVRQLTGRGRLAMLTGLLFAVHPLHVESVAWITERKDMLSTAFYLAACICFRDYEARGGWRRYASALLCGLAALLAKPVAVTLPAILLLAAWYRDRRVTRRLVVALVPFGALAAVGVAVTLYTHSLYAVVTPDRMANLWANALTAARGTAHHFEKVLWPVGLSALYPQPSAETLFSAPYVCGLAVGALLLALLPWVARRHRLVAFGLAFFLVALLPSSRLVPAGIPFLVADRFFYLAGIGLLLLIGAALDAGLARARWRRWTMWVATAMVLSASALTWQRALVWRDDLALWGDAAKRYPASAIIQTNYGMALAEAGNDAGAQAAARAALACDPTEAGAHLVLAHVALARAEFAASLAHAERAMRYSGDRLLTVWVRADALSMLERQGEAITALREGLVQQPLAQDCRSRLALELLRAGDTELAESELAMLFGMDPTGGARLDLLRAYSPRFASMTNLQRLVAVNGSVAVEQYEFARRCHFDWKQAPRARREYELFFAVVEEGLAAWREVDAAGERLTVRQRHDAGVRAGMLKRKCAVARYNYACLLALAGEVVPARASLKLAVRLDENLAVTAAQDPDLEALVHEERSNEGLIGD